MAPQNALPFAFTLLFGEERERKKTVLKFLCKTVAQGNT